MIVIKPIIRNSIIDYGRKKAFVAPLILLIVLILTSCGIDKPPNESQIRSDINDAGVHIVIDGNQLKMNVTKVSVDKRQTNEKRDIVYCTVTAKNTDYTYETVLSLNYMYYDKGGWLLEGYGIEPGGSSITPVKGVDDQTAAMINRRIERYFPDCTLETNKYTNGQHIFEYKVSGSSKYLSYSGIAKLTATFNSDGATGRWDVPMMPDMSGVTFDWGNITGRWHSSIGSYNISMFIMGIRGLDSLGISPEASVYYDNIRIAYLRCLASYSDYIPATWIEIDGGDMVPCVNFVLDDGPYPERIEVWIYPDYAECKYINHGIAVLEKDEV